MGEAIISRNGSSGGNSGVGLKTVAGGEIFNDYEGNKALGEHASTRGSGNIAGGNGFKILNKYENIFTPSIFANLKSNISIKSTDDKYFSSSDQTITDSFNEEFVLSPGKYYISASEEFQYFNSATLSIGTNSNNRSTYNLISLSNASMPFYVSENMVGISLTLMYSGDSTYTPVDGLYINILKSAQESDDTFNMTEFIPSSYIDAIYCLDDISGIAIDDIYSVKIGANYDFCGQVVGIIQDKNFIIGSNCVEGTSSDYTTTRMWFPYKPEIGTVSLGGAQSTDGLSNTAINWAANAEGYTCLAEGRYSHAQNKETIAGFAAHSEGELTRALAEWSHAQGMGTTALGRYAFSYGNSTVPMSSYIEPLTSLDLDTVEETWDGANPGFLCAFGIGSSAGGNNTLVLGNYSSAHGVFNKVKGSYSHSHGSRNRVFADRSTVYGSENTIWGTNSFITGYRNGVVDSNFFPYVGRTDSADSLLEEKDKFNELIDSVFISGSSNSLLCSKTTYPLCGENNMIVHISNSNMEGCNNSFDIMYGSRLANSHIEGYGNKFNGPSIISSHIEGLGNTSSVITGDKKIEASHIEGYTNYIKTNLYQTHIEGVQNNVGVDSSGAADIDGTLMLGSHIEGAYNRVYRSNYAHVQGSSNKVYSSNCSHIGGWNNTMTSDSGFAHGQGLIANGGIQFVIGRYNVATTGTERFVVGNGTGTGARSNAFTVYQDGHAELPSMYSSYLHESIGDNWIMTKKYVQEMDQNIWDACLNYTDSKIQYGTELPTEVPSEGSIFILLDEEA